MKQFDKTIKVDPYKLLFQLEAKATKQYKQIVYGAMWVDLLWTEEQIRNLKTKLNIYD